MKGSIVKRRAALAAVLAASVICVLQAAQQDVVFDAMRTELKRSMKLTLGQLDKPYYLSYQVDDQRIWSASATLGGLVGSNLNEFRAPNVRIRVGDYKFDN